MTNQAAPSMPGANRWSTTSYADGQRDAAGEVDHRGEQAASGERGGLQAAGEVAQLLDGEAELGDGAVDLGAEHRCRAVDPGRLQLQRDGQQSLLRAVVEVALDAPALLEVRGGQPGPRLADQLDLAGQLGAQRDVVDLGCGLLGHRLDHDCARCRCGSNSSFAVTVLVAPDVDDVLARARARARPR